MTADLTLPPSSRSRDRLLPALLVSGAAAVLVSGYVHYYLYFEGGYRGIQPEAFLGLTISRAFLLNAIAAVVIAEASVLALRWTAWARPAAVVGIAFALSTLGAFAMSRTVGLLGFTETETSLEAVIAVAAELVALVAFSAVLVRIGRQSVRGRTPATACADLERRHGGVRSSC